PRATTHPVGSALAPGAPRSIFADARSVAGSAHRRTVRRPPRATPAAPPRSSAAAAPTYSGAGVYWPQRDPNPQRSRGLTPRPQRSLGFADASGWSLQG